MNAMRYALQLLLAGALILPVATTAVPVTPTPGLGFGTYNRLLDLANLWDHFTNRNYGGYHNALSWPGAWSTNNDDERRTYANYKGFVIGARNVPEPQYHDIVSPYMVGQRDGRNDGVQEQPIFIVQPDTSATGWNRIQFLFKGRLVRRTYRQDYPDVSVNGVVSGHYWRPRVPGQTVELVGDEADAPYQEDAIDPTIPCDLQIETYSWTRMGIANSRMVYTFVDRDNDDAHFWHWRLINDGIWGRLGIDMVDSEGPWPKVEGVMHSFMFQWDRTSAGAIVTGSSGEANNDSIWDYYGRDYDGARSEDMRLVWVRDGDQDVSKFPAYPNGSTDDTGDPHPLTGDLLTAKAGGLQFLHYDMSTTDRRDDPAQPRTIGWVNYGTLIQTSVDGHEAKYNQMLWGLEKSGEYYRGDVTSTPGRGAHPYGGSWIKASNDPATSGAYWPGRALGVDIEVTDVEQQAAYGPKDMAAYDTLNMIVALGVNGLDMQTAQQVGRDWMAGTVTDAEKNARVFSAKDSLFRTMRQAKAVYEAATFDDGHGGVRHASTRYELEDAFRAAVDDGILSLSPPAPATFDVEDGSGHIALSWTLNTSTGSDIAGWRLYRALGGFKSDSAWTLVGEFPPGQLSHRDDDAKVGYGYYYYLTTFDAEGHESTMHTRTSDPAMRGLTNPVGTAAPRARLALDQNAPNPFNPSTTIRFAVRESGPASLVIYDVGGGRVRALVSGLLRAGAPDAAWDGTAASGRDVASGTYIYRLESGGEVQVRRMALVR